MFSVEASRLLDDERLTIVAVGDAVNGNSLVGRLDHRLYP